MLPRKFILCDVNIMCNMIQSFSNDGVDALFFDELKGESEKTKIASPNKEQQQ